MDVVDLVTGSITWFHQHAYGMVMCSAKADPHSEIRYSRSQNSILRTAHSPSLQHVRSLLRTPSHSPACTHTGCLHDVQCH